MIKKKTKGSGNEALGLLSLRATEGFECLSYLKRNINKSSFYFMSISDISDLR